MEIFSVLLPLVFYVGIFFSKYRADFFSCDSCYHTNLKPPRWTFKAMTEKELRASMKVVILCFLG